MPQLGTHVPQGEQGEVGTAPALQAATFLSRLCLGGKSLTNTGCGWAQDY